MDTVTQMLFGGAVAQAGFRKRLGRRASAAGAVLGLVPDLDVVTGWFTDDVTHGWLYHRGATHSIPVALVYGAALGWAIWWLERRRRGSDPTAEETARRSAWMWLGALCCATHALIDLFTAYGTQLLAPFMDARFAIHAMPIIDPLYSLPLLLAFIIGLTRRSSPHRAARWAQAAIIWVSLYTLMAWGIGLQTETRARAQLARDGIEARGAAISAYPTLLQPFWRRVVVDLPDGFLTGYASPLDGDRPIRWQRFSQALSAPALQAAQDSRPGRVFGWFAMGRLHWTLLADSHPANPGGHVVEARDYRYGAPGAETGFWGLRFRLDAENRLIAAPVRLSERPSADRAAFRTIWNGIWGLN